MEFSGWSIQIPIPVALAIVATMGYLISRWRRAADSSAVMRSCRELRRAQAVATDLEKTARTVRQNLAKYHASISKFKERVGRLNEQGETTAWRELCQETEGILGPTLRLATQMAIAYDDIRQQSANLMTFTEVRTDPLTGLNNRRGLDDALASQLALMSRYQSPFSVAMLDIDHFKQVNDREGHLNGDRVLQQLSHLFEECVRETDLLARYGGEEFVVVMPQTDLAGACILIERLRYQVANRMEVTVSGGVAAASDSDTAESLLGHADTALYSAKVAGRNRIFCHTGNDVQPVPEQEMHEDAAFFIGSSQ
ncbi:MAG: GGDEF domain-containing protein [Thermoguttaceae bacterium]